MDGIREIMGSPIFLGIIFGLLFMIVVFGTLNSII